jgi:AcrR family transcriptional regulator
MKRASGKGISVGRLPRAEVEARRREVVQTAQALLEEVGFERFTMLQVAERCGASKETLYAWFGNKEGLFAELITASGQVTVDRLGHVFGDQSRTTPDASALRSFARGLLGLLVSPWSVAINRAAMASPTLAAVLLANGRHRVGPLVEAYLSELDQAGVLRVPNPTIAFTELYGLVVRDTQIRVLLGEPVPPKAMLDRQADAGIERFWETYAVERALSPGRSSATTGTARRSPR